MEEINNELEFFKPIVESIIFASPEPISVKRINEVIDEGLDDKDIVNIVSFLNEEYKRGQRSFRLIEIADGWQFNTLPEFSKWITRLLSIDRIQKLSRSALETLAIICYKQPITRSEIEAIRGVDVSAVLFSLLEKKLIKILKREKRIGRPLVYGTTQHFLKYLGLKSLDDLPELEQKEFVESIIENGKDQA